MNDYRQILVDGSPVGLRGFDRVLADLRSEGRSPGEIGLGLEMVKRLSADNYIPSSAREVFAVAFEREYAAYLVQSDSSDSARQSCCSTWRGYPRESIPWFPTINEDLCNGCGVCLKLCSSHCLAPTEGGKVWVANPFSCVIGCSSCATVCKPKAITFPPRLMLDMYKPR